MRRWRRLGRRRRGGGVACFKWVGPKPLCFLKFNSQKTQGYKHELSWRLETKETNKKNKSTAINSAYWSESQVSYLHLLLWNVESFLSFAAQTAPTPPRPHRAHTNKISKPLQWCSAKSCFFISLTRSIYLKLFIWNDNCVIWLCFFFY